MKTYKRFNGSKAHQKLHILLNKHELYKKSFFWTTSASQRRRAEFKEEIEFAYNGITYEITQELECSCKNFYYSLTVLCNGEKKDIRAIKKLLN